jgi:hypothetical protein
MAADLVFLSNLADHEKAGLKFKMAERDLCKILKVNEAGINSK